MIEPSWMGRRVSVRRVVERTSDGGLRFADVVGDLVGLDAATAVIETRDDLVEVPVAHVAAARAVPASSADELALEAVAAQGMRPADTEPLGGWVLRADHGFLRRTNSVLPLRTLGMPVDEALERARDWYRARDLPLLIAAPTEARRLLDADLQERGWDIAVEAHLMTGRLDRLSAAGPSGATVSGAAVPDEAWLALYRGGAGAGEHGRAMLARHDRVTFVTVSLDGEPVAIGRGAVDDGWLGVSAVEVAPAARRRGLATAVMSALFEWGRTQGARRSYLQVETDNAGAITLYDRLGYRVHHDYRYRADPETTR